jgi:hypothetical protein
MADARMIPPGFSQKERRLPLAPRRNAAPVYATGTYCSGLIPAFSTTFIHFSMSDRM